jgi:hypothetical protein
MHFLRGHATFALDQLGSLDFTRPCSPGVGAGRSREASAFTASNT